MGSLIALQVASTLALVGLIWFVQIVHYPMLRDRGAGVYARMHAEHSARTGLVVVPLMLVELVTAVFLVVYGGEQLLGLARAGLILVGVAWASTFFIQVPLHGVLSRGWDVEAHRRLVRTNWIRTVTWTARGFLVLVLAWGAADARGDAHRDVAPTAIERVHPEIPPAAERQPGSSSRPPPAVFRI